MARALGSVRNTLKLWDNISNSELVLYYRNPTTKERQAFQNASIKRHRNKVVFRQAEARLEYGLKILVGFRDGDFVRDVNGKQVPLSSDKKSEHYDPDWKHELERDAADLVMLLASHVFEAPSEVTENDDDAGDGGEPVPNSQESSPQ